MTEYAAGRLSGVLKGGSPQIVKKTEESSRYIGPKTVALKEILEKGIAPTEPLLR